MLGSNCLKHKRVLLPILLSICMLVPFAPVLSEPLGSSSSPVSAFADNSALVPTPFTGSDELSGADENSCGNDDKSTAQNAVASLSVCSHFISYFVSLSAWFRDFNSSLGLLDIPPPSHTTS
jgi:hypothetical protein